ncbi:DUF6394 family protein [Oceanithermus sp.]
MNSRKLITDFFVLMALTTNVSFVVNPNGLELFITVVTNLAATLLKIGEGRVLSAELMATGLVADLHLIPALYFYYTGDPGEALSLAWGALAANVVSVLLVVIDTVLKSYMEEE